jgi:hypothetical protein
MRWNYKTVQYGLKKEGLLGSSFLDEAEVEQSLNEFGQAGWELVSLFGMQDGLMAVFKQPVERKIAPLQEPVQEPVLNENTSSHRFSLNSREGQATDLVVEGKIGGRGPDVSRVMPKKTQEEGVGSIRIE